jgi:hypothetical protein
LNITLNTLNGSITDILVPALSFYDSDGFGNDLFLVSFFAHEFPSCFHTGGSVSMLEFVIWMAASMMLYLLFCCISS